MILLEAKFVETKLAEQQALEALAESLQGARAPLVKVSSDRGAGPTHKAIRFHCRPFVELRSSLLLRHQITQAVSSSLLGLFWSVWSRCRMTKPLINFEEALER